MAVTYDSTKDTITGDKLMLFITDGSSVLPVAFGTSCNIDVSADTIDTSNKMSGNWKEFLTGQLGYTIASESMLSMKEGHLSFKTLKKLMASRTPIPFVVAKATEANGDFTKDADTVKGKVIITALNMTAQNGSICTSSCTLQGTGPLEDGDASSPANAPAPANSSGK